MLEPEITDTQTLEIFARVTPARGSNRKKRVRIDVEINWNNFFLAHAPVASECDWCFMAFCAVGDFGGGCVPTETLVP